MESSEQDRDAVALLECNIDDMTAEALGFILERLMTTGALDAWFTPIIMKKGRPATLLSVLCPPEETARLRQLLLRETTTLGVRWHVCERDLAQRQTDEVQTPWGPVRRKVKLLAGAVVSSKPEFEDCARIAREQGIPLQQVVEFVQSH